ncbi:MAG: hypothetical protein Q9225_003571 [Loekoesia sp. 1 TL-2023]
MGSIGSVNFDVSLFGNLPALLPPPGETSNFEDPYSRGPDVVIASAICLALMLSMVLLRFYTKLCIKHIWGWDDLAQKAIGPHQWNVPVAHFTDDVLRLFIVVDVIYSPAVVMAKLSLLVLYLEVFRPDAKLRYAVYSGIIFVAICYTAFFIAYCVLAIPRPGQTLIGTMLSDGVASLPSLAIAQGAINVASDFYIFLLPIPGVLQLQLPTMKKIGICAIFMTGSLACLASVMGLCYRTKLNGRSDVTWQLVDVLIWVVVELTVGVMCSCMPAFTGFFHYYLPLFRSIGSFLSSRMRSLNFLKLSSKSTPSSSESSKRLATKDIKMTLGTQIDGRGQFLNPTSVFAQEEDWLKLGQAAFNPPSLERKPSGTRREWHEEMAELKRQSLASPPPMTMSRKHSVQTLIRSLPIHDEEKGKSVYAMHADAAQDRSGYF